MGTIQQTIDFLTDPSGVGFPFLIAVGLGIILWLMRTTTKDQKKADKKIQEHQQNLQRRGPDIPEQPF